MPDAATMGPLLGAVGWLTHALLGSVATSVAALAIAAVGCLLLTGRIPVTRGAATLLGCFIIFSASTIANGIVAGVRTRQPVAIASPPSPAYDAKTPSLAPYDPYAGASLPTASERPIIR